MELLESARGRIILATSEDMYVSNFPDWETANSLSSEPHSASSVHAYAARGRALLAERWNDKDTGITVRPYITIPVPLYDINLIHVYCYYFIICRPFPLSQDGPPP